MADNKAIIALILNLLIPGVGSLYAGKKKEGIWQLVLYIVGFLTLLILIGWFLMVAAWIWALVTSIKMLT